MLFHIQHIIYAAKRMLLNTGSFYTSYITYVFTIIVQFRIQYYVTSEAENVALNKTFISGIA
jgi:hypothetical protein